MIHVSRNLPAKRNRAGNEIPTYPLNTKKLATGDVSLRECDRSLTYRPRLSDKNPL